jgi:hypothetical protein
MKRKYLIQTLTIADERLEFRSVMLLSSELGMRIYTFYVATFSDRISARPTTAGKDVPSGKGSRRMSAYH